ncbi:MAG: hypothetical protein ABSE49_27775 [Polyangiaceae bacterium]
MTPFWRAVYAALPGMALAGTVVAVWLGPHGGMAFLVACALTFVLARETAALYRDQDSEETATKETSRPPNVEHLVAAAERDEAHDFSCVAFELPWLVCPRTDFREILSRHDALLREHLPAVTFLARRETHWRLPLDLLERYAAEIDVRGGGAPRLAVRARFEMACRHADLASVAHRVAPFPGRERMNVVVIDDDAASVHKVEVRVDSLPDRTVRRELVPMDGEVTCEPVRQDVERDGTEWVRRWRASASSPTHEVRFTHRPPAASPEECIDRLFVACHEPLRKTIAYALEKGRPMAEAIFWCGAGKRFGPYAQALAYERAPVPDDLFESWPRCDLAVRRARPQGWVPVFVTHGRFAGIRWAAVVRDADEKRRPASVTELKAGAARPVRVGPRVWSERHAGPRAD